MKKLTFNQMGKINGGGTCHYQMWRMYSSGAVSPSQYQAYWDLVHAGYNMVC
ncbi:hypothetical protein [Flammeovirga pectinis]|uniref:hypothetical protein n=1 Tax=Flammeovirga pectinis TaxID=2494373 RepID=UPI0012D7B9F7|nr:hypothetical protein [Flammeovirga pectinis]